MLPGDFTEGGTPIVKITYPEDWSVRKSTEGADLTITDAAPATARIDVLDDIALAVIPEHALSVTQTGRQSQWQDYRQERSDITVSGAKEAYQVDYSYTAEDGDAVNGVDLVLVGENSMAHQVKITWSNGGLDPDIVDSITETVEVVD